MPSEPEWSKQIPSSAVYTLFYALAELNLIFGVAGIIIGLYLLSKGKITMMNLFNVLTIASVGLIISWSLFIICNRTLNLEDFRGEQRASIRDSPVATSPYWAFLMFLFPPFLVIGVLIVLSPIIAPIYIMDHWMTKKPSAYNTTQPSSAYRILKANPQSNI